MKWEYHCQCSLQFKFKQNLYAFSHLSPNIAQQLEHLTSDQKVVGSSPALGTMHYIQSLSYEYFSSFPTNNVPLIFCFVDIVKM